MPVASPKRRIPLECVTDKSAVLAAILQIVNSNALDPSHEHAVYLRKIARNPRGTLFNSADPRYHVRCVVISRRGGQILGWMCWTGSLYRCFIRPAYRTDAFYRRMREECSKVSNTNDEVLLWQNKHAEKYVNRLLEE